MALSLTSRSALRTLNEGNNPQKSVHAQKSANNARASLFATPGLEARPIKFANTGSCKPVIKIHADPAPVKTKTEVKERVITKAPEPLINIEQMHICDPEKEIKPKVDEKAVRAFDRFRKWSMSCWPQKAGLDSDSESDYEDDVVLSDTDRLEALTAIDEFVLADLSDIDNSDIDNMPFIDDLPIPFADDSLDIEPNMGTLEMWDTSTPLTMSPSVRETSSLGEEGEDESGAHDGHNTSL